MQGERGFTLIELLIVSVLIAILAGIALTALLGQRDKAHDAEAKSNAANVRVKVEACAVHADNTYLNCATAASIQSDSVQIGMLDLPPFGQFAAAGGNQNPGNGNGNTDNNGVKNGAQCIPQSNGQRACEQTDPGTGGTTGGTTTPPDTTTGGTAPAVGDCVEGGDVEAGCVGIVATATGYTITSVSKSTHVFKIVSANGVITRPCSPSGAAGCPAAGNW